MWWRRGISGRVHRLIPNRAVASTGGIGGWVSVTVLLENPEDVGGGENEVVLKELVRCARRHNIAYCKHRILLKDEMNISLR